jgi:hypothetical protein
MKTRSLVPLATIAFMFCAAPAYSAVAPSRGRAQAGGVRTRCFNRVRSHLHRRKVARHLEEMGMDPAEVAERLERLGDDELFELSRKLDETGYGAGACEDEVAMAVAEVICTILLIMIFFPFYLLFLLFSDGVIVVGGGGC